MLGKPKHKKLSRHFASNNNNNNGFYWNILILFN